MARSLAQGGGNKTVREQQQGPSGRKLLFLSCLALWPRDIFSDVPSAAKGLWPHGPPLILYLDENEWDRWQNAQALSCVVLITVTAKWFQFLHREGSMVAYAIMGLGGCACSP